MAENEIRMPEQEPPFAHNEMSQLNTDAVTPHVHNGQDSPPIDARFIMLPTYATIPTHNAPEGSLAVYNNGTVSSLYVFMRGAWRPAVAGGADTLVVGTASISNDANEGTMYTRTVAANSLSAGQMFRVRMMGRFTTANSSDYVTMRFKIAGATILSVTTPTGTVTDKPWYLEFIFTVRTIGASGQVQCILHGSANGVVLDAHTGSSSPTTVDTTAAANITFTCQWSAATSGDVVRLDQGVTEVVTP